VSQTAELQRPEVQAVVRAVKLDAETVANLKL
jgi:hypothetical protein